MKLPACFDPLPDATTVRVVTIQGGLPAERTDAVVGVLTALLDQWRASGTISAGAAAPLHDGAFLMVAYVPTKGTISGCTRDQLTHTLLTFEQMLGRAVLNAPRCIAQTANGFEWLSPAEFRAAAAAGRIDAHTPVFDLLVETLGDVRAGRLATTAGQSWYARLLPEPAVGA